MESFLFLRSLSQRYNTQNREVCSSSLLHYLFSLVICFFDHVGKYVSTSDRILVPKCFVTMDVFLQHEFVVRVLNTRNVMKPTMPSQKAWILFLQGSSFIHRISRIYARILASSIGSHMVIHLRISKKMAPQFRKGL